MDQGECLCFSPWPTSKRHHRGLVGATDASGQSIFKGKRLTGFSNVEEELAQVKAPEQIPWLLETKVRSHFLQNI